MKIQKAKYEVIADWIVDKIKDNELVEGDKIPPENKMVSIFGVSRQTVRHAISILEEQGLVRSVRGSGTYIKNSKQGIRKKRMCIAVIMTYVDEYIFPEMIAELGKSLSKSEYTMRVLFTHNSIEKERNILTHLLKEDNVDGIIVETTKSGLPNPNLEFYRELEKNGIKLVFMNSSYPNFPALHVCLDDYWAGKTATEHLIKCGHKEIGAIFKLDDGQGHKRYAGYVSALMEHEIHLKSDYLKWVDTDELINMEQNGNIYLERLNKCTACVCYNDEVAMRLINICRMAGIKVPEELSIIGIDNSDLAKYCTVPITSVNNPVNDLAKNAVTIMLGLLSGEKITENVELKSELILRKSTKIIDDYTY